MRKISFIILRNDILQYAGSSLFSSQPDQHIVTRNTIKLRKADLVVIEKRRRV